MQILTWGPWKREFAVLAFDATGRYLAAGGGGDRTVLWDVVTGTELLRHPVVSNRSLCVAPVANRFVLATDFGLYTFNPGEEASVGTFAQGTFIRALAVHPVRDVAVCYHHLNNNRTTLSAIDLSGPEPTVLWDAPIGDTADETGHAVELVAVKGGEWFVSAECVSGPTRHMQYRLAARSWDDGRKLRELSSRVFEYGDQLFGSSASTSVVVQSGIWLRIRRSDDFSASPRQLRNDGRKHFTGAAFHPSGRYLAATSNDATVKLYDTTTLEVARTFTWDIGRMRSIAFSPDGTLAAAGSDKGKVVVWDVDL